MNPRLSQRYRTAIGLLLIVALTKGCSDDGGGVGPTGGGVAFLNIQPVFRTALDVADFGLVLDSVAITVARPDAPSVFVIDTTVYFDPDSSTVNLGWALSLRSEVDTFVVSLRLLAGPELLFNGGSLVLLRDQNESDRIITEIVLDYVGPGQNIASISIAPADSVLTFGDSLDLRIVALDSADNRVDRFFVSWETDDETLATANANGLVRNTSRRGVVQITARTPTGITNGTSVTIIPLPASVIALVSNPSSAVVGTSVELGFRVLGDDGLGISGVPVTFQAPAGASIEPAAVTDSDGVASTTATLGTESKSYAFGILVPNLDELPFSVEAIAAAASTLSFEVHPSQTVAGDPISPAIQVTLKDAFGNLVGGHTIALGIGTNPGGGILSGQTSIVAPGGVATFGDLSIDKAGAGYTLVASTNGVADVTSSTFDIVPGNTATVEITPAAATLNSIGETVQFSAVAKDANGNTVPGASFTWSPVDVNVATVDAAGLATAVANGSTNITATSGGVSGSAAVTVSQTVSRVAVTPASTTLNSIGATQQFSAEARDANGNLITGASITWSPVDANVATVDAAGLATAVANGSTNITATSGGVSGSAAVTVSQIVTSVVVTPASTTLNSIGATQQFSAEARDANGNLITGASFTWSPGDVNVATVDATGLATATGNGSSNVTATSGGVSGSAAVTVSQIVASVVVTPASTTLNSIGATQQFSAEARDANGNTVTGVSFTWNSVDPTVVTVNATGLATAVANGGTSITATGGGQTGAASVTVTQTPATVTVTPPSATLNSIDEQVQFVAEARDANGNLITGASFTWSPVDANVATVDAAGLATAVTNGSTNITATSGGVSGSAAVTVSQTVASVVVTPPSATLNSIGATQQFSAEARDANGNAIASASFTWSPVDANVATVDAAGLATAVANGSTNITATSGGVSGSAAVTVSQTVASVVVTPPSTTLNSIGATQQFTAEARDANGNAIASASFTWSPVDANVATVDAAGLATAVANGSTNITATSGGVSGSAAVTVSQTVASVVVTPPSATLNSIGATEQFSAEARDANGNAIASASFTWSPVDANVATVDAAGLATAVTNGTTNITATSGGVSGSAAVTVSQTVASIDVTPASTTLNSINETVQLNAVARDANGNQVSGAPITWSSTANGIATVDVNGLVAAVAVGTAQIVATSGTVTGTADITVLTGTTTTLTTSAPLAVVGTPLTLTATVSPIPPAVENPTVEFFDGSTSLGTAAVSLGATATLAVSNLSLATHSLTARLLATANFGSSVSSPVTQEMIQSFRTVAAFNSALGGAASETQDFESQTAGTAITTVIPNVVTATSAFVNLEVADSSNNLFLLGFDATSRQAGNGSYTLDFDAAATRNALGFDLIAQDPTATAANLVVITDLSPSVSFTVDNQSGDVTMPSFIGIVASIPLRQMLLVEGFVAGGSGTKEQVGLDNFVTALVTLP